MHMARLRNTLTMDGRSVMRKNPYFIEMIPLMFSLLVISGFIDEVIGATGIPLDANPCVADVPAAFEKIQNYGEKSGFWIEKSRPNGDHYPLSNVDYLRFRKLRKQSHIQGIQRLNEKPYFIMTGSSEGKNLGHFYIGKFNQTTFDGRLGSNLTSADIPSDTSIVVGREDLKVIKGKDIPMGQINSEQFSADHSYGHAGGLQVIGDYAAVALAHGGDPERIVFYDLSSPEHPLKLPYEVGVERADAVAIAKRVNGKYLLIVRGDKDILYFFESSNSNLQTPEFLLRDKWTSYLTSFYTGTSNGVSGWRNYQNINLVSSCDGSLYLLGFSRESGGIKDKNPLKGEDWMDLYRVDVSYLDEDRAPWQVGLTSPKRIKKIGEKHIYCQNFCNFAAGGGIYASDQNELVLYGVNHFIPLDQEEVKLHGGKPNKFQPQKAAFIQINEFRSFPPTIPLPLINTSQAWVALYDDANFEGPRVLLEGGDVETQQWSNYQNVWGNFDKKVSSVRWVIPQGYQYGLYRHADFKGDLLLLKGNGQEQQLDRLRPLGFNDSPSSSKLLNVHITNPQKGWVELFSNKNFEGRRLHVWGTHTGYPDLKQAEVEGQNFENAAQSARFHLAKGQTYRLYRHPNYNSDPRYPNDRIHLDLVGTGEIEEIRALSEQRSGLEGKVSSAQFVNLLGTISDPSDGWIELYSDDDFKARKLRIDPNWSCPKRPGSQSTCTYQAVADYRDVIVSGKNFDNNVESIRFQLAPGQVYRLYRHPEYNTDPKYPKDRIFYDLKGTGTVVEIRTLSDVVKGLEDKVSSSKFIK